MAILRCSTTHSANDSTSALHTPVRAYFNTFVLVPHGAFAPRHSLRIMGLIQDRTSQKISLSNHGPSPQVVSGGSTQGVGLVSVRLWFTKLCGDRRTGSGQTDPSLRLP